MINSVKKIKFLCLFTFFIIYFFPLADYIFAEDERISQGKPFKILQKQIDDLNLRLDLLFGQSCPDGEFMTGFDTEGRFNIQ